MDEKEYFWKTKKRPPKTKARAKPLPKAKEAYLEAEETLFQELEEHSIGYERKFQFIESIADMDRMMEEKKKLNRLHLKMTVLAVVMSGLQWAGVVLWITTGIWWPFAACWPFVIALGIFVTRMYHKNTLYICPECGAHFRPSMKEMMWAKHTPKTRLLTCTKCGYTGWCVETYGKAE